MTIEIFPSKTAKLKSGRAEEIVREAIAGRRDEVFLVSKVLPTNASHRGTLRACEASLERLGTDRLDCYLLHWSGSHPLAETIAAFEELLQSGKIRSFGVSNFDVGQLEEAVALAGPGPATGRAMLSALAEKKGVTTHALALAFLTRRPNLFAIPKSSSVRHVEENASALSLTLAAAEIATIDRAFPPGKRRRGVAML